MNFQSLLPTWTLIALAELGQKEIAGTAYNPRIAEYLKTVGQPSNDEIPWCAAFVNWCLLQTGIVGTKLANAKSFMAWGKESKIVPGAIIIQNRGNQPWMGHVSIVVQVNQGCVFAVGGNQSDMVSLATVPNKSIISTRMPV